MGSWSFRRALLAIAVGLSVGTGVIRAQEEIIPPSPNYGVPPPIQVFAPVPEPAPRPKEWPLHAWVHGCLERYGYHCAADIRSMGCGSCKADFTFVFGSCRAFFGEGCVPQIHPWRAGLEGDNRPDGQGREHCNCR
jgi:hypothetical protein